MKTILPNLKSVWLILVVLFGTQGVTYAYDVIIQFGNSVTSSNGSFQNGIWVPSASPSILSYADLITQLNQGDVTVSTGATPGDISFEEVDVENSSENLGYDFPTDHTLTLMADGNITMMQFGIIPVSPANTGKLNVEITFTGASRILTLEEGSLFTNGGNVNITGADDISILRFGINTQNALMESGSLSSNQGKFDAQRSLFELSDVNIMSTDTFRLDAGDIQYNGQVDISAKILTLTTGSIKDVGGIDDNNASVHLTATDSIGLSKGNIFANDEIKFTTKDFSLDNFMVETTKNGLSLDASGEVNLNAGNFELTGDTEAANVNIGADDLCMQLFQIHMLGIDNQSDLSIEANTITLESSNIQSINALDDHSLSIEAETSITMDAFGISSPNSDIDISITAGEFIHLSDSDKDEDCLSTGNFLSIDDANLAFELISKEVSILGSTIAVNSGNGKIKVEGTEKVNLFSSRISITDNGANAFTQNELTVQTKVFKGNTASLNITNSGAPGLLNIIAADTLIFQPLDNSDCLLNSLTAGGGSYFVQTSNAQMGTVTVQAGYTYLEASNIYADGELGDLIFEGSDDLTIFRGQIGNRVSTQGDLSISTTGDLFLTNANLKRGRSGSGRDPNATGNTRIKAHSIYYPEIEDEFGPILGASIESVIQSGDLNVMAQEEISFKSGSISSRQANGSGTMMISAQKIDLEQSCIYMTGSTGQMKVQAEDIDLLFSDFYNEVSNDDGITASGPIFLAGTSLDLERASFSTDGGNITASFQKDINLLNAHMRTEGGDLAVTSLEGGISVVNEGDDLDNTPDDKDGLFTGNTTTDGGNLSLAACTGIDIQADLNTGIGTGGSFTTMGMPISTIDNRRFPGTGNINLKINEACTALMVDIQDPCECDNLANIYEGTSITYFNEIVTITGANDDTWTLMDIVGGSIFDENGVEITDFSTLTPTTAVNGSMTDYTFTFWHEPGVGYDAIFEATSGTSFGQRQFIANSCDGATCEINAEDVPANSNWNLVLLAVLLLSISIIVLARNTFKLW